MGMEGVCSLGYRAIADLSRYGQGMGRWGVLIVGMGIDCAVVGASAVMERWEVGTEIVLGAVGGCLGLGGVLLGACLRVWSR